MTNWFYYSIDGAKIGVSSIEEIKQRARLGMITPDTIIENEAGKQAPAGKVNGLTFAEPFKPAGLSPADFGAMYLADSAYPNITDGQGSQPTPQAIASEPKAFPVIQTAPTPSKQKQLETNPFTAPMPTGQIPSAPVAVDTPDGNEYNYRRIALLHRLCTWSILIFWLASGIVRMLGISESPIELLLGSLVALGAFSFSIVCMVRLARLIQYGVATIVLLAICLPLPLLCLVPLILVYFGAGEILKQAGYKVGLIGADMRQFDPSSPEYKVATNEYSPSRHPKIGHVIAIIVAIVVLSPFPLGMLRALLHPAVQTAREAVRRMQCSNNEKEMVLVLHNYYAANGAFPPLCTVDEKGKPLHSWRVLILPYMEQSALYEQIRLDEPWNSDHNQQFHSQMPLIYQCPSNPSKGCTYSATTGNIAVFPGEALLGRGGFVPATTAEKATGLNFGDYEDGLSNTIAIVEVKEPFNWMDPTADITLEELVNGINTANGRVGSFHPGGCNVGLFDATVRFISETIDKTILRAMGTIDGGESVSLP